MKFSPLATAVVFASLSAGAAQATTIVNLDATKGNGVAGFQTDAATVDVLLAAGSYRATVIDNTANGGYAGWVYNTGGRIREAFDYSLDGGLTTVSIDVYSSTNKFISYASTAEGLTAFAAGPFTFYNQSGTAYDGSPAFTIPTLDFTLNAPTVLTFGIPDNRFGDNRGGVSLAITAAVPEPQTYALMLAGLGAIGFIGRRRKNA